MSKRSADEDPNPERLQRDVSLNTEREDTDQIVEMAAEQLADLLWRHWLYMKILEKKGSEEPDS